MFSILRLTKVYGTKQNQCFVSFLKQNFSKTKGLSNQTLMKNFRMKIPDKNIFVSRGESIASAQLKIFGLKVFLSEEHKQRLLIQIFPNPFF